MWLILGFLILVIIYFYYRDSYTSWKIEGKQEESRLQYYCDIWKYLTKRLSSADFLQNRYNSNATNRYYVLNKIFKQVILVRDPDLIKQILVEDFDHFLNHVPFMTEEVEPLWKHHIPFLNNQSWKFSRKALSPVFTNSKLTMMIPLLLDVGHQLVDHFLNLNTKVISLEMNDFAKRFMNDIIANIVFGVKYNSMKEPNNEFYKMQNKVKNLWNLHVYMKMFLLYLCPQAGKIFKFRLYSEDVSDFFKSVIRENRRIRNLKDDFRPDIVQFLLKTKEKYGLNTADSEDSSSDEDIVALQLNFILSGFKTVASLISFISYELAVNPDVQNKVLEEIDGINQEYGFNPTYEAFTKMTYFNKVASETLRLWPGIINTNRVCTIPYTIQPKSPDEKPLYLQKNDVCWIPTYSLHRDPKLFPNPDRFDPERFDQSNAKNIKPYSYIPFGAGPRKCLAYKFALLEAKIFLYFILTHFTIIPDEKTQIPLKISKKDMTLSAENGCWLSLRKRKVEV